MRSRSRSRSKDRHKKSRHRSRSNSRSRASRSPHRRHRSRSSPDRHRSSKRSRSRSRSRSRDRQHREDSRHHHTDRHQQQQHPVDDRGRPGSRWAPSDAPRDQPNGKGWQPDRLGPSHHHQQQQQRLPPPPDVGGQFRAPLGAPLGRWGPGPGPVSDEPPPVNSIHRGRVANIRPFGLFISIPGCRRDVLVHHTQVSDMVQLAKDDEDEMKVKALEFVAQRGQEVWVKVTEVTPDASGPGFRLHGSMVFVSQEDGRDLDPTGQLAAAAKTTGGGGGPLSEDPPEAGSIHRGTVKRIEPYGVFVALPGYKRYGLVHSSQVSNYMDFTAEDTDEDKKRALAEVVGLGDSAWVKVVEVSPADEAGRGPKIGCSMKLVNQSDGTDLDPQGMRYSPRGEGGGGGRGGRGPIGADAGEIKGGKINWGYLAGEVKQYGDSKYDMLADDPEEGPRGPGGPAMPGAAPGAGAAMGGPPLPAVLPPAGRGRGATLPAWMTSSGGAAPGAAAPGSLPGPPPMPPGGSAPMIRDVDEAMAILRAAAAKQKKSKHKKDKKKHKHKGEKKSRKSDKKHSKSKDRKERRSSRDRGTSSSSSSSSGGSGSDHERRR